MSHTHTPGVMDVLAQEQVAIHQARVGTAWHDVEEAQIPDYRANFFEIRTVYAAVMQEPVGSLTVSTFRGHLENTQFDYTGKLPDGTYSLYVGPRFAVDQGYDTAFYEIASVLGISARPEAPAVVFKNEMLPRLKTLVAAGTPQPAASVAATVDQLLALIEAKQAEALEGMKGGSGNEFIGYSRAFAECSQAINLIRKFGGVA